MQCNIVCNGTLSLGQGRLVGMHDCSSAPIVLLVEHARAAGTFRDMGTGPNRLISSYVQNVFMADLIKFWLSGLDTSYVNTRKPVFIWSQLYVALLMTSK